MPAIVRVTHASGSLAASPETIRVPKGCSVQVQLIPPVDPGMARTRQSVFGNRWLNKSNVARDEIVLTPPDSARPGDEFKYSIEVDGVGTLDPRIVIQQ